MKKIIVYILVAISLMFGTYRYTMKNLQVDVYGNTAVITVYGQMDIYEIN